MISNIRFKLLKRVNRDNLVLYMYRFMSLFFISVFYIVAEYRQPNSKFIILVCLVSVSVILSYLYNITKDDKNTLKILILIETIGNIIILIPTGGLGSPCIWYALSTLLITLNYLSLRFAIVLLSAYIVLSTRLSQVFLGNQEMSFLEAIYENAMSILGMILITWAVAIILNIAKKSEKEKLILSELNEKQTYINGQLKKSMSYMLSVYQAVHSIANERNEDKILNQILDNTAKTVEAEEVFYFKSCKKNDEIKIKNIKVNSKNKRIEQTVKDYLLDFAEIIHNAKEKTYLDIGEKYKMILMPITSNNYNFGFIGVLVKNFDDTNYSEIIDLLKFMAQITEISLEKIQLEKINNKLIINEEQNRIASEIHDSVTQRLFAASCSMRAIMDNKALKEKEEVMSELGVVRTSLTKAIKELRETIYSMSWEKKSANALNYELKEVIDEFSNMYGIPISFNYNFKSNVSDYVLVKSIFRIVYETTSNALRHSNCSKIRINVFEKDDNINILISDNGVGINTNKPENSEKSGFGLRNINTIVKKHNGRMKINSQKEKGTLIKIMLPFHNYKGAEAV